MIIECFALPEVGKSTIINNLQEQYNVKAVPLESIGRKSAFLFALKHPISVSRFVLTFLKEGVGDLGGWQIVRFKLSVFASTMSRIQLAGSNYVREDIVIIDEGLIQRLLSLYETKQPASKYVSLLKKIPLADSMLFLEYKGESERIKNGRVGTMRRSVSDAYTEAWRSTMLHNYHSLVDALKSMDLIETGYSRDDERGFDLDSVMKDLECRRIKYCKNGK
jgi:hypothetical protein